IRRSLTSHGELQALVDRGLKGITSNPSIFEKAIVSSADYNQDLLVWSEGDKSAEEMYQTLALEDITRACDVFAPVYEASGGQDGFVNLEVNPRLAAGTQGTIAEAKRLQAAVNRPNLMIKIPATPEGIPAITALIAEGINVNATLIFSLAQYQSVAEAYMAGLRALADKGGEPGRVASVASFFISRLDSMVDRLLAEKGNQELLGKTAVAVAKTAYVRFKEIFSGADWEALKAKGARVQRLLWASTGVKNPLYPDTLYVDQLIGADTVNTLPPATLSAFEDHGTVAPTLDQGLDQAQAQLAALDKLGISLESVAAKLLDEGIAAFTASFESLLKGLAHKRDLLQTGSPQYSAALGSLQEPVQQTLSRFRQDRVLSRIWAHDHTLWKPEPKDISNRLGWLDIAERIQESLGAVKDLVKAVQEAGYTHALLLGMGGSSLAPEVFAKTFGTAPGHLDLAVLDSTDPEAVAAWGQALDLSRSLFIVSTKSGGTVETLSFFKYFYNLTQEKLGEEKAGEHFVAITDPGSKLDQMAREYGFRKTFRNDPNIGGRYSVLSYFGLVPAALVGVDPQMLLDRALIATSNCESSNCPVAGDNSGARLGAVLGTAALEGRDKVTIIASPSIASFSDWVEQLIAESTGKEGKGILPVVGEPLGPPQAYASDRLFVYLRLDNEYKYDAGIQALEEAGHPCIWMRLNDLYDLGGQFFTWEMATAVAGHLLGINPFDQPNVEAAKVAARDMVAAYQKEGRLPELEPAFVDGNITVYGDISADDVVRALEQFMAGAQAGAYVALQAYIQPSPEADQALLTLRLGLRKKTQLATTSGYGPRFLHSTGQLHKGDAGRGLFIQFTSETADDVPIPDSPGQAASTMSFGVLKLAQALGDRQALLAAGRQVIRFHIRGDVVKELDRLSSAFA
ncbi:MAG: bifunctional transaldolase/phosoglucose isomerase, partial [Desulfarculaceae bacterium]